MTAIVAWSPTSSCVTSVLSTEALTTYEPVETTTTWPLDDDPVDPVDALVAADEPPKLPVAEVLALPVPDGDEPPPLEPETCWPTVRLREATVPLIVEVKVALATLFSAVVT